jgi:chromosome segregation ATPase
MSYYNTVEIDRDELRRLERKARESESLKSRLERERRKRKSDISRIRREFDSKIKELNKINNKLSAELREVNNELLKTKGDIETIKKETQKNKQKINEIIANLNREKKEKKELALFWINNLNAQIDMIKELEHEKFKPNELNRLLTQIELARKNFENGMYEAAVSSLQERYLDAVDLFEEVFLLQKEFEDLKAQALENLDELKSLLEAQRVVEYELEGQKIEVDVDYWSEGRLSEIEKEISSLEKEINDKNTSTKRLREILKYQEKLKEELINLSEKAKHNLFMYQARVDSANDIIDILDEMGFEAVDNALLKDDKRKSLFVKFENESEEEIMVILSPKDDKNVANIMFDIESTNPKFKDLRLNNILKELNKKGVRVENFACTDNENPRNIINEFKDFEKVKEGRVEDKLKKLK